MTFYIDGPNAHELMPVDKVFKKRIVEGVEAIVAERAIDADESGEQAENRSRRRGAVESYRAVDALPRAQGEVVAAQVMSAPVVVVSSDATVSEALALFRTEQIRHLPVVSPDGALAGMVSERDVLRHLGGVTDNYQRQMRHGSNEKVGVLMQSPVLTASADTDVRHIARLFVEQRVGALPIVADGELKGIIARSDVLKAVMRYFVLELWV
ncbi:MAG TPA: CBS domain-containing protein [Candidatus Tenderia sp.]|nr:CBS domain-containing protein [Candidatus Tenderia sp.]